jgi:hypothetical protein
VPDFYHQLAAESNDYGVFDVPYMQSAPWDETGTEYTLFSSYMQFYQMFHGKGIAAGYLSRTYAQHPVFRWMNCQSLQTDFLNQSNCIANVEADLICHNYRYVVIHKNLHADEFSATQRQAFLQLFATRTPLVEDADTVVYAVGGSGAGQPELIGCFGSTWYPWHPQGWRWTTSPAQVVVDASAPTTAMLEINTVFLHDPNGPDGLGTTGVLQVDDGAQVQAVTLRTGAITRVPVQVRPSGALTMTLAAGNFQPTQYGGTDPLRYSFAVRDLRLVPPVAVAAGADVLPYDLTQVELGRTLTTLSLDASWYAHDAHGWRWAASPARLGVAVAAPTMAMLELEPALLHDPDGADGLGSRGLLRVDDGTQVQEVFVHLGAVTRIPVRLQPNGTLTFELAAGNFQPTTYGSSDPAVYSFALKTLRLVPLAEQ